MKPASSEVENWLKNSYYSSLLEVEVNVIFFYLQDRRVKLVKKKNSEVPQIKIFEHHRRESNSIVCFHLEGVFIIKQQKN